MPMPRRPGSGFVCPTRCPAVPPWMARPSGSRSAIVGWSSPSDASKLTRHSPVSAPMPRLDDAGPLPAPHRPSTPDRTSTNSCCTSLPIPWRRERRRELDAALLPATALSGCSLGLATGWVQPLASSGRSALDSLVAEMLRSSWASRTSWPSLASKALASALSKPSHSHAENGPKRLRAHLRGSRRWLTTCTSTTPPTSRLHVE